MRFGLTGVVAVAAVLGAASRSHAQSAPPAQSQASVADLQRQINQLQQRLNQLEGLDQKVAVLDRRVEKERLQQQKWSTEVPNIKVGTNGLVVESPDKEFTLNLHGIIQADGQFYSNGGDKTAPGGVTSSTFTMNRVRPIISGTVFRDYDYNVTPDFGQGKTVLQEGWIDAHPFQYVGLLSGKFKAPFGLERLQTDQDLLFIQRGLTNNLIPNRDLGAELHGDLLDGRLTYQLAFLNGVPNNSASVEADTNDGKDFVGRLFTLPFKDSNLPFARGFGLGFAGSYGDTRGATLLPKYVTAGQSTFFTYGSTVSSAGPRHRLSPQGYYYWGPFALLAEAVDDTQAEVLQTTKSYTTTKIVKGKKVPVTVEYPFQDYETFANHAWAVEAGLMLTGEDESYYGIKPRHNFNPSEGGWGAWEIKGRVGSLDVDTDAFKDGFASAATAAQRATEFGGGLNWYLNQNVKVDLEYLWTQFYKGAVHGDRPGEGVFLSQVQLVF